VRLRINSPPDAPRNGANSPLRCCDFSHSSKHLLCTSTRKIIKRWLWRVERALVAQVCFLARRCIFFSNFRLVRAYERRFVASHLCLVFSLRVETCAFRSSTRPAGATPMRNWSLRVTKSQSQEIFELTVGWPMVNLGDWLHRHYIYAFVCLCYGRINCARALIEFETTSIEFGRDRFIVDTCCDYAFVWM